MRYAFVSDIHANLQAWQAVSADIDSQQVDDVICLGDVVGYGPRPSETLREIHAKTRTFIMGNHDAVVADILDSDLFNEEAQRMIEWTKKQLSPKARKFFARMPYTVDVDCGSFTAICVHGAMHPPESFYYIYTEQDARMTWDACEAPLVFVGHTHEPRADFLQPDGSYFCGAPEDFAFDPRIRTIVNVGSVGLPRSQDPRACYAIFDTETSVVSWRRVEYSIEELTQDIHTTFGKDASRALAIFEHAADVSQDEEFSPKLVASTQSINLAKSRMRRVQDERLTNQPMPQEKKVAVTVAVLIVLFVLLLSGLGLVVLYNKSQRERDEAAAKLEEEDRKLRSAPSQPTRAPAQPTKRPDSVRDGPDTDRPRVNRRKEPDYEKMRELFNEKPPGVDTEGTKQPDGSPDTTKQPKEGDNPPEPPPKKESATERIDLSKEVPESAEYQLLYELDLAKLSRDITYDKDNRGSIEGWPVRIAYVLELKKAAGSLKYVYVSMDAFTRDLKKMGIPDINSGAAFQDKLKNLKIITNVKRLKAGNGIDGNIEFWPHSYTASNADNVSGASGNAYDFGDSWSGSGGYGSMQIHNTDAKQTVFAINKWHAGQNAEMGIGNSSGTNKDWTFTRNAANYTVKRLRVLVKMGEKPPDYQREADSQLAKKPTKAQNKKPTPKEPVPSKHVSIKVGEPSHYFKADNRTKSTRIADFTVEEGKGRKLVLAISWEGKKGVRARWKGTDFTIAVQAKGGRNAVIMYLDDPEPGKGDIQVRFDEPTQSLLGAVSVTGTAPGIAVQEGGSTGNFQYETKIDRCLLVGVCSVNKEDGKITSPFNEERSIYNGNSGSSFGDAGTKFIMTKGSKSLAWKELQGKKGVGSSIAVFEPMLK